MLENATSISVSHDTTNHTISFEIKNKSGSIVSSVAVPVYCKDLSYNNTDKKFVMTMYDDSTKDISIESLVNYILGEIPEVVNNVDTADASKALSANMGKELSTRIENLKSRGRYLSNWNCITGLPYTDPVTDRADYAYNSGDYYIVGNVLRGTYKHTIVATFSVANRQTITFVYANDVETSDTSMTNFLNYLWDNGYTFEVGNEKIYKNVSGTNTDWSGDQFIGCCLLKGNRDMMNIYCGSFGSFLQKNTSALTFVSDTVTENKMLRPNGNRYVLRVPSTTIETEDVSVNDTYIYDGDKWILQINNGQHMMVVDTELDPSSENPVQNKVITVELENKVTIPDGGTEGDALVKKSDGTIGWGAAGSDIAMVIFCQLLFYNHQEDFHLHNNRCIPIPCSKVQLKEHLQFLQNILPSNISQKMVHMDITVVIIHSFL